MRLIDADELIKCIPSEENNSRFAVMNDATTVESPTSATDNIPFTSTTGTTKIIEHIPKIGGSYGWICPVCGRGNAPWNSCCP